MDIIKNITTMVTIYTLKLENGKYYVGRSNVPKNRILNHFSQNGSEWTKLYKPKSIVMQIKGDEFDEEKHTLIAMEKYGIDNVRGGSYCKVKLSQNEKEKAQQTINSIMDKCYKCGDKGHFSKDCKKDRKKYNIKKNKLYDDDCCCDTCGGSGVSYWTDGIYGNCLSCCCIDCGKNCTCTTCDKCKDRICDGDKHECICQSDSDSVSNNNSSNTDVAKKDMILQKLEEAININKIKQEKDSESDDNLYQPNECAMREGQRLQKYKDFITNDIIYEDCSSGIVKITHPITKQIVKKTLRNNKLFYESKWIEVPFIVFVNWYKSIDGVLPKCHKCGYTCSFVGENNYKLCNNKKCDVKWCK